MNCDAEILKALAYGGAILGGGGGGLLEEGLELVELALRLGRPQIIPLGTLDPDHTVVTVSLVGAPAAKDIYVQPTDYVRAVERIANASGSPLAGLIQSEMGGLASANGFIQSVLLDIPIIDAPCNGRAHPLGAMGSMGLHKEKDYLSIQSACGGDPDRGRRIDLLVQGDLVRCAAVVRQASIEAGGMVAVARNPVRAQLLKERAAVGAVTATIDLGRAYLKSLSDKDPAPEVVAHYLGGEVIATGVVNRFDLKTKGGLDVGRVLVEDRFHLAIWNEYLLLEEKGERRYTFPDLIALFDTHTQKPINSSQLKKGMEVVVVAVKKEHLILGDGMRDPHLFMEVEKAIGEPMVQYVFENSS